MAPSSIIGRRGFAKTTSGHYGSDGSSISRISSDTIAEARIGTLTIIVKSAHVYETENHSMSAALVPGPANSGADVLLGVGEDRAVEIADVGDSSQPEGHKNLFAHDS